MSNGSKLRQRSLQAFDGHPPLRGYGATGRPPLQEKTRRRLGFSAAPARSRKSCHFAEGLVEAWSEWKLEHQLRMERNAGRGMTRMRNREWSEWDERHRIREIGNRAD